MKTENEGCYGCNRKETDSCAFLYDYINEETGEELNVSVADDCPCMTCIVKAVCTNYCDARCELWSIRYDKLLYQTNYYAKRR